mgnify:CR=1 FL=1
MLGQRYHWVAKYEDGSALDQIDPSGNLNAYKDIDRDKLAAFEMWEGASCIFYIRFKKGQRLIWRRRVEMSPNGVAEVCHIVGKQETVNGKNYQGIIGLFESDGRIEIAGSFEEGHPWLFPVKTHPDEGEEWQAFE